MRKPGLDESNVQMSDILCDFCRGEWTDERPMVEGHQGACICGKCLLVAYIAVVINHADEVERGYTCTMCLEERPDPAWSSPLYDDAVICRRCIKQSAGVLHKDKDIAWSKPEG